MNIVNQVVFPTVARLQEDRPRLRERLLSGLRLLGFVSVPIMWGISSVAPELVTLALGPRWQDAVFPLPDRRTVERERARDRVGGGADDRPFADDSVELREAGASGE